MIATLERVSRRDLSHEKGPTKGNQKGRLLQIPVENIDPNPHNARGSASALEDLEQLAATLEEIGLVQPVLVRPQARSQEPGDRGQRYQLVAGERRWRAARLAGQATIEAIVRELTDAEARVASLAENLHRKNLNPLERARGFAQLCATGDAGAGLSQTDVARMFGYNHSVVSNSLRLLKLPAYFQAQLVAGELVEGNAKLVLSFVDDAPAIARIERDMRANPWAWRTRDDFERNLPVVAGDAPQPDKLTGRPRAPRLPPAANVKPTARARVAEASPAVIEPAPTVEDVCALICRMNSIEDLAAVKEAIELRMAFVAGRRGPK